MKKMIVLLTLVISQTTFANLCLGEAQFIAQVAAVKSKTINSCVVTLNPNSIRHYQVNQTCPLDLSDVLELGIEVGLINGHDCAYTANTDISGVIVQLKDGRLILE